MLDRHGFDLWADGYDRSVQLSEASAEYPFAGYREVLNAIYQRIRSANASRILELGFGTGILAKRLYDDGCSICGVDFSESMLAIALAKMPDAELLCHDFSQGLPAALHGRVFDAIVCTYAIHHLTDERKVELLHQLQDALSEQGQLLIGDVAFETGDALEICRVRAGELWDDEEAYPVAETLRAAFPALAFEQHSFCAGVLVIPK